MFGLMSRAEHERILAEGQERARATIAKANADRDDADGARKFLDGALRECRRRLEVVRDERDAFAAKLAKFTAPRKRDALGHFVKDVA